MDKEQVIRKYLSAIGEDYDRIPDNLKQYLVAIHDIVDLKQSEQRVAVKTLKDNDISVSGVCAELGMSRNTAYRHGHLLQRYIEYCARQLSCTNPLFIIDGLKADIAEQHRQICLMADRDIDALKSRLAVTQRDRLLQEKAKLLEQKEKRIMELTRDCQQLRIALEQSNPSHRLLKLP